MSDEDPARPYGDPPKAVTVTYTRSTRSADLPLRDAGLRDAPITSALDANEAMVWAAGYNAARRDIAAWLRAQIANADRDDDLWSIADRLVDEGA